MARLPTAVRRRTSDEKKMFHGLFERRGRGGRRAVLGGGVEEEALAREAERDPLLPVEIPWQLKGLKPWQPPSFAVRMHKAKKQSKKKNSKVQSRTCLAHMARCTGSEPQRQAVAM